MFLEHYPELEKVKKTNVYTWQEAETAQIRTAAASERNLRPLLVHVVYLRNVSWQAQDPRDQPFRDELLPLLERRLRKWLVQNLSGAAILISSAEELAALRDQRELGVLALDCAITEIKRGSGLLRYLVGFGVGAAIVRLELKGAHYFNGEEARYLELEAWTEGLSGGQPWYGLNLRSFSTLYCLRYALDNACRMLVEMQLKRVEHAAQPWWAEQASAE